MANEVEVALIAAGSGILGSAVTLTINAIKDYRKRISEQKYGIDINFLNRKLDKAEIAIAFYTEFMFLVESMKISYEKLKNSYTADNNLDIVFIQNLISNSGKSFQDFSDKKNPMTNAFFLYFDCSDLKAKNDECNAKIIEAYAINVGIRTKLDLLLNAYNRSEIDEPPIRELMPSYIDSLSKVIEALEETQQLAETITNRIIKKVEEEKKSLKK